MAGFSFSGLDDLILSMAEVEAMPEYVQDEILNAQADVLVIEIQRRGEGYGVHDSGKMLASIKKGKAKRGKKGGRQIVISARGERKNGVSNGEVAFLNNYGTRHQKARPFWSDAEKLSEKTMQSVGFAVYDRWLKSKGL